MQVRVSKCTWNVLFATGYPNPAEKTVQLARHQCHPTPTCRQAKSFRPDHRPHSPVPWSTLAPAGQSPPCSHRLQRPWPTRALPLAPFPTLATAQPVPLVVPDDGLGHRPAARTPGPLGPGREELGIVPLKLGDCLVQSGLMAAQARLALGHLLLTPQRQVQLGFFTGAGCARNGLPSQRNNLLLRRVGPPACR